MIICLSPLWTGKSKVKELVRRFFRQEPPSVVCPSHLLGLLSLKGSHWACPTGPSLHLLSIFNAVTFISSRRDTQRRCYLRKHLVDLKDKIILSGLNLIHKN